MKMNVNIKRSCNVNGKEYRSLDEMPPDIRALLEKTAQAGGSIQAITRNTTSKIVLKLPQQAAGLALTPEFNGVEYESPDAMPT